MNELKELEQMVRGMDELIGYWFEGYNPSLMSAGGDDVYTQADNYRNRALEIIENLKKSLDK